MVTGVGDAARELRLEDALLELLLEALLLRESDDCFLLFTGVGASSVRSVLPLKRLNIIKEFGSEILQCLAAFSPFISVQLRFQFLLSGSGVLTKKR